VKKLRDRLHSRRLVYNLQQVRDLMIPDAFYRARCRSLLDRRSENQAQLDFRVDYCNRIDQPFRPDQHSVSIAEFNTIRHYLKHRQTTYYCDLQAVLRYFDRNKRFNYLFGDIRDVPSTPTLLKSRPVGEGTQNSVLLKLNRIRHFNFVTDRKRFVDKMPELVWRGKVHQAHRRAFLEKYHGHPRCDVGQVNSSEDHPEWVKPYMSAARQLDYKFILCIEGNDVASSLKWTLSSNSLCVMTRPRYETWFMEGCLEPGVHYVGVRDDYSDLEEKLEHYSRNPKEAEEIIGNAQRFVAQFLDPATERYVGLAVLAKYFRYMEG